MTRGYLRPRMFKALTQIRSIKVKNGEYSVSEDTEDNSDEKIPKVENTTFIVICLKVVNGRCRSLTLSHCISEMCLCLIACS
jgi:hypothetical protein